MCRIPSQWGWFYRCIRDDFRVWTKEDGLTPKNRPASVELRRLRIRTHEAFDRLWKHGYMKRTQAYLWLQEKLGLSRQQCHIGQFNRAQCHRVIALSRQYLKQHKKGRQPAWHH